MKTFYNSKRVSIPVRRARHQAGVTLIELLVGIVIGLLVIAAAVGSLAYTKTSAVTVGDSSRLQQDASTAFRIIGAQIRQTGARRVVAPISGSGRVEFNGLYQGYGVNAATGAAALVNGADGASDTLQVSRDGEPNLLAADCLGEQPVAINNITNRFFHQVNAAGVGELRCQGSGATSIVPAGANGFPLVQGVEDFQVLYGFRTNNDFQYRTATQITAVFPPPWSEVETIMVCLRMVGETTGNPITGANINGCLPGEAIAPDGRIRKVFFRVFNIRNAGL